MNALLCPSCGRDIGSWLAHRRPLVRDYSGQVMAAPMDERGAMGCCPECRSAFQSDGKSWIRLATEDDIASLHPANRATLAALMRGASADEVEARHGFKP